MFHKMLRIIGLITLIILIINTVGCWGRIELENLGLIVAMGIDKEADGYTMTLHIIRPQTNGGDAIIGVEEIWVGNSSGQTLFDASKNFRARASAQLTWMHNRLVIIGEETARDGLDDVMDFLIRNREIRTKSWILVTQGKAMDALQVTPEFHPTLYQELQGLIENQEEWSKQFTNRIKDVNMGFGNPYRDAVTTRIILLEPEVMGVQEEETDVMGEATGQRVAILDGAAVFKGTKMVGWLTKTETRSLLFLEGEAEEALIVLPHKNGNISIEVGGVETEILPSLKDARPSVEINIKGDASIVESTVAIDFDDTKAVQEIERKFNEQILGEIENSISKFQGEYNADILGIGDYFHRKHTNWWKENQNKWFEGLYQDVELVLNVDINIDNSGLILMPFVGRD